MKDTGSRDAVTLDLTGLKCPLPALRTAKALKGLMPGQHLIVTCTDPMAAIDIPNLIRETGDVLESSPADAAMPLVFRIRKTGGKAD
jgi:tRNA 2-thiouridine synthesizing protein A